MYIENCIILVCKFFKHNTCKIYELNDLKLYVIKIVCKKFDNLMDVYLTRNENETIFLKLHGIDYYISMLCPTDIQIFEDI